MQYKRFFGEKPPRLRFLSLYCSRMEGRNISCNIDGPSLGNTATSCDCIYFIFYYTSNHDCSQSSTTFPSRDDVMLAENSLNNLLKFFQRTHINPGRLCSGLYKKKTTTKKHKTILEEVNTLKLLDVALSMAMQRQERQTALFFLDTCAATLRWSFLRMLCMLS